MSRSRGRRCSALTGQHQPVSPDHEQDDHIIVLTPSSLSCPSKTPMKSPGPSTVRDKNRQRGPKEAHPQKRADPHAPRLTLSPSESIVVLSFVVQPLP